MSYEKGFFHTEFIKFSKLEDFDFQTEDREEPSKMEDFPV